MARKRVQIDIVGPSPNEVDIADLATLLDELRKAVTACLPDTTAAQNNNPFASRVSLVEIVSGSDGLVFEVQPLAVPAMARISRTLRSRHYNDLPRSAHESLHRLNQFAFRRNWGLRFRGNSALGIVPIEVIKADHVTPPISRKTIEGGTSLLARCLRVGGATKPRGELRLLDGTLLNVDVSEIHARELGKRLYDEVVLHGIATWDATSGEMLEFSVTGVSSFHSVPPTTAFRELAAAAKSRWDDVDAEEYVSRVRESSG